MPHERRPAIEIDLGDVILSFQARVPGLHPPTIRWRVGPVREQEADVAHVPARPGPRRGTVTHHTRGIPDMSLVLTATQETDVTVEGFDARGNSVADLGELVFESSDPAIVTVVEGEDGKSAVVRAVGAAGSALITVTDDTDRDGSVNVIGSLAVDVVAGQVTSITVNAGTPREQEEAAPEA